MRGGRLLAGTVWLLVPTIFLGPMWLLTLAASAALVAVLLVASLFIR